ncbi:MBL fold metallo-hydrolase [Isoptericola sp. b441]|uniref:MBL fold metallo-hydrolase n=1 Tax=Actinotalea lenta TaxID=3064654 RepID=A0ABT9D9Y8_9CELL|nr:MULTISPECIES: MBL fold metallo-hydrolase [unclassified Isoptericola]MDO8107719.1 MBL fold metallo-hydrolase [Isoptericola sp. b441]MDO8120610.1 MBL fold metallo-hydrolase [Isoptericola sp. b490]
MTATILTLATESLGDRSYLVHDGEVAFVVDPQRDVDRVLAMADEAGVRITHVLETHIHNDYVTGGFGLAQRTGASYHVNADDPVSYERVPTRDGDLIQVGSMTVRAVHTPGHTFTHLSYVLEGERPAVFSGGSLLYGSTGRPDLLGAEHAPVLARHQHASAHRLAELPHQTVVMPTHGFGSFCSATATTADATGSTIGQELRINPALTQDEEEFVEAILAGLDDYPAYYVHMGPRNLEGPAEPDLSSPARADKAELRRRLDAGEWLVDLRTRTAFAAGHVPGTINLGLDGQFSTYLGWLIPWGAPLTLLGSTPEDVAEAQRELVRIGIDRPAAAATGEPREWTDGPLATTPRATFGDLALVRHHRPVVVLDVRRASEWRDGHVAGATNIPLHELVDRIEELPEGEVWVHCAAGYRASAAASLLARNGRRVVHVDEAFTEAATSGLELEAA